ncbi:secretory calcium-binding phosphoprotein 1 isoform X3 [Oncorhynchus tshawytscha]|nr:secretory calcium-binding phosphoprotein 1 isoform X3 [Oncorhynchus tshawytscha]
MTQTQRLSSPASQSLHQSDTSELKSSEESTSEDQSSESESESLESNSESSESHSLESASQSLEDRQTDSNAIGDTRDNSQGSEENVRKNWIRVFAVRVLSAEDNSSSEVKGQLDLPTNQGAVKQSTLSPTTLTTNHSQPGDTVQSNVALALVESFLKASGSLSETSVSIDTSDVSAVTGNVSTVTSDVSTVNFDIRDTSNIKDTSDSSESSESSESSDTSETSDSSNTSDSKESDTSESEERHQSQATDCQQGVHSTACDSEEYFIQDIGDDGQYPMDDLLMPEEEHRELSLRR